MKNDPWISALVGVLGLLALTFLALCYFFITNARESRRLQPQIANANVGRNVANMLANDVFEYSKQHPDILEFTGLRAATPPGAVAPPTGLKPPGK